MAMLYMSFQANCPQQSQCECVATFDLSMLTPSKTAAVFQSNWGGTAQVRAPEAQQNVLTWTATKLQQLRHVGHATFKFRWIGSCNKTYLQSYAFLVIKLYQTESFQFLLLLHAQFHIIPVFPSSFLQSLGCWEPLRVYVRTSFQVSHVLLVHFFPNGSFMLLWARTATYMGLQAILCYVLVLFISEVFPG